MHYFIYQYRAASSVSVKEKMGWLYIYRKIPETKANTTLNLGILHW